MSDDVKEDLPPIDTTADAGAPASDDSASEVNWDEYADDSPVEAPPAAAAPADVPPAAPAAPAAAVPSSPPPAVAAPPVAAAPASPNPPVTPAATPAQTVDDGKGAADAIKAATEKLTATYQSEITEEQIGDLLASPEKVLPGMLAKAAMDGAQIALMHMQHSLPATLARTTQQQQVQERAFGEFYAVNGDLNKPEYRQAIVRAAAIVKETQRNLTKEQQISAVARVARATLGLPELAAGAASAPAAAPVAATGTPFTPVGRGNSAPPAPKKPAAGEVNWSEMAEEDD